MTTTKRLLCILALLAATIGPAVGTVGAQASAQTAELAIEQPAYVSEDVSRTETNGTTVYHVRGEQVEIAPQNFVAGDVVNYGVATDAGDARLSFDRRFGQFSFSANQTGSYEVFWVTEREVSVTNETTNTTTTQTRQQRFTAIIRVEGQTQMQHVEAGSLASVEADAEKWRDFNSSVLQDLQESDSVLVKLGFKQPPSTEQLIQQMTNAWMTIHKPFEMLTGNFSQMALLAVMTLGGWLFMLFIAGPLVATIGYTYYRYNVAESVEADEGRLASRLARFDQERSLRAAANQKLNEIFKDDHVAGAMSAEGENTLEAVSNWYSKLRDRTVFHSRLQAMHQCGYVAVVDEKHATDGGSSGEGSLAVTAAHVQHTEDVPEDAETTSLNVAPEDELIDALDWDQDEIREFDLVGADFDRTEVETPTECYDIEELAELMEVDQREFDDYTVAAEYMAELFADVREHPLTDEHGVPDTLRWGLEQHLDAANLLTDRFEMPIQYKQELFERALADHNTAAEAEKTLKDIREGGHA